MGGRGGGGILRDASSLICDYINLCPGGISRVTRRSQIRVEGLVDVLIALRLRKCVHRVAGGCCVEVG